MKIKNKVLMLLPVSFALMACTHPATYTIRGIEARDRPITTEAGGGALHQRNVTVYDTITLTVTNEQIGNPNIGDTVGLVNSSEYCCIDFVVIGKSK